METDTPDWELARKTEEERNNMLLMEACSDFLKTIESDENWRNYWKETIADIVLALGLPPKYGEYVAHFCKEYMKEDCCGRCISGVDECIYEQPVASEDSEGLSHDT